MNIADIFLVISCFAGLGFWGFGLPAGVFFISQLLTNLPERQRWLSLAANRLGKYSGIAWLIGMVSLFVAWLLGGQVL